MKKLTLATLCVVLGLALAACGQRGAAPVPAPVEAPAAPVEAPTPTTVPQEVPEPPHRPAKKATRKHVQKPEKKKARKVHRKRKAAVRPAEPAYERRCDFMGRCVLVDPETGVVVWEPPYRED